MRCWSADILYVSTQTFPPNKAIYVITTILGINWRIMWIEQISFVQIESLNVQDTALGIVD